jgi:hypothetical protein
VLTGGQKLIAGLKKHNGMLAARECRARAFEACERDLDLAQKIDPASESLPAVKAMRREIDRGRHAPDAKPE